MDGFEIIAALVTLAAVFSYLNHRYLELPTTIGLMVFALLLSLGLIGFGQISPTVYTGALAVLERIDFDDALMHGMLGFLLFAGALHVDLDDLAEQRLVIGLLASLGLLISTFVVATFVFSALCLLGVEISFTVCLLFGALISPTDPIAVLSILKTMTVSRSLQTQIAGESLFNDGVAVVVFLAILGAAGFGAGQGSGDHGIFLHVLRLFAVETLGGVLFGLGVGYLAYRAFRSVDSYEVEILLSLALVAGGYAVAEALHISGPIAMVIAGLLIGNHGRRFAMSKTTRDHLDTFWNLVDEVLNAILFVLIGLEVLVLSYQGTWLAAAILAIPGVLLARLLGVAIPLALMRPLRRVASGTAVILTWGGLRGGISVALALSLSSGLGRTDRSTYEGILLMTYVVVSFSILAQGLSVRHVIERIDLDPSESR